MKANAPLVQPQEFLETDSAVTMEMGRCTEEQAVQVNKEEQVNQDNQDNQKNQVKRGRPRKTEAEREKTMKERAEHGTMPLCDEKNCHAWQFGRCIALWNNDFGGKRCPFYKPMSVCQKERKDALTKMIQDGRMDLVEKYKAVLSDLGVFDMEDGYADRAADDLARYSDQYLQELLADAGAQPGLPGQPEQDELPEQSTGCAQSGQSAPDGGDAWDDE